jgi:signal transduction histidine kinase
MQIDPPLVVWTTCRAWLRERFRPGSLGELSEWLSDRIGDILQWDDPSQAHPELPHQDQQRYADQVMLDLQVSGLAVQIAGVPGGPPPERVRLLGLLAAAPQWLRLTSATSQEPLLECVPTWLGEDCPAMRPVHRAVSILDGSTAPDSSSDLEACRHRAEDGRSQWLESGSPWAAQLPRLTAILARLTHLEGRFQETLDIEKLAAMAELAAGAGHEINNPLAIIAGRAQLLMADETDPERRRELAVVNAQVKRAYEMIADMRLFARPPRPEPRPFDLVQLVDALVEDMASQAAERAITIRRTGDAGPLIMEADPTQLEVALRALCKNSLEVIAHHGQIQIDVSCDGDLVRIRVIDDGPGVLPEHRRHLFDPFYSARQAGRGLGLGLSKCWRIVTNHGGHIEVQSEPGRGAVFAITLPRW